MKNSVLILILLIFLSSLSSAQSTYEFLRLDPSARAGALGGSFVSNNDDADVIFYNPAGLSLLNENPISFSFVKHLMDINLASLSYSTEINDAGRFGAAVKYINYGSFDESDEFGNRFGEFGANEIAFILGYSNALDENFYYGANAKFIYSGIADRSSTGLALDLGLHYAVPEQNINFGVSVLNLGSQISSYYDTKEDLPLDIVVGGAVRLQNLPARISVDFHKLNEDRDDFVQRFKAFAVGVEFTLSPVFKLRFGYNNERRSELKIGTTSGIAGFNAGLGAKISDYLFDYGYSSLGLIGGWHRVGISTNL
jgi:hypothetical protein